MQDVFLDRRANPPHRVGGKAEAPIGVELLDRLHQPDIAFGNQFGDRQAVAPVAHRDLGDQAQMAGDHHMRGIHVVMLDPAFGRHEFLLGLEHGEFADFLQVARQIAVGRKRRKGR